MPAPPGLSFTGETYAQRDVQVDVRIAGHCCAHRPATDRL